MLYSFTAGTLVLATVVAPALAAPVNVDGYAYHLERSLASTVGKDIGKKLPSIAKTVGGDVIKEVGKGAAEGGFNAVLNGLGGQPTETVIATAAASATAAPPSRRGLKRPAYIIGQGFGFEPILDSHPFAPALIPTSVSPTATSAALPTETSSSPTATSAEPPAETSISSSEPADANGLDEFDALNERRSLLTSALHLGEDGLKDLIPKIPTILEGFGSQPTETSQTAPSAKGANTSRRELNARKSSIGHTIKNGLTHAATHDVPNMLGNVFGGEVASLAFSHPAVTTIVQAPAPAQPTQAQRRSVYDQRSVFSDLGPIIEGVIKDFTGGASPSPIPSPVKGTQSASRRSLSEDQMTVLKALVSRAIDDLD